jgi:hypothetical protein
MENTQEMGLITYLFSIQTISNPDDTDDYYSTSASNPGPTKRLAKCLNTDTPTESQFNGITRSSSKLISI